MSSGESHPMMAELIGRARGILATQAPEVDPGSVVAWVWERSDGAETTYHINLWTVADTREALFAASHIDSAGRRRILRELNAPREPGTLRVMLFALDAVLYTRDA